jgi:D-threo-aldose 1-dehydrogenase
VSGTAEKSMQTVELTLDVISTRIGFGCAGLMREASPARRREVLEAAFQEGIRHFDVARMYGFGAAEKELGRFARGRRDQLVIATKFGIEPSLAPRRLARLQGPARRLIARYPALRSYVKRRSDAFHQPRSYDAATARRSLETSLRELQTDYVDVLFLHGATSGDIAELSDTCAYLETARQAGHLRAWGVAGEDTAGLEILRALPAPALLQSRADIFTPVAVDPSQPRPAITFGILSSALERIVGHVAESSERRARWSRLVGNDCTRTEVVADLLVRDALARERMGVVLYSTTRPDRLRGLRAASRRDPAEDSILLAFQRQVHDELAPDSDPHW